MQFKDFLIETQTISQYIKTQREFSPELYKSVKNALKQSLISTMPRLGTSVDRYVNWATYWGIKTYLEESMWGNFRKKELLSQQNTQDAAKNTAFFNETGQKIARVGYAIIQSIGDYIVAHLADNNIQSKFNTVEYTPDQAKQDSADWHYQISIKQSKPGGKGRLLLKLDRLGPQWADWRWLTLGRGYCAEEANAAGHCGNANAKEGDNILSLRDPQNHVHLTFIVNNGILGESKGRGNHKPSPKYHAPIIELLRSKNIGSIVGGGWDPDNNFHLTDLPKPTQAELLKKKPLLNNPFRYSVQNITNDKELLNKINDLFEEPIEKIITDNGNKIAVIESFENFAEIDNCMSSYSNCRMENVGWMDDPWEAFQSFDYSFSNDALSNYLDELDKDTKALLEKYLDKALEDYKDEEDFDELTLYDKLLREDDDILHAVRQAIDDGLTAGTENDADKHVKKELGSQDSNGFYFEWWVSGSGRKNSQDEIQLRISLTDLEKVFNSGMTNPKDAVEINYSQPNYGYSGFDSYVFNERLKNNLAELKNIEVGIGENMITFQDWMLLREGRGKHTAKSKRDKPITPWKGSWAQQEEERKKKGEGIPVKNLPKLPSEKAVSIKKS